MNHIVLHKVGTDQINDLRRALEEKASIQQIDQVWGVLDQCKSSIEQHRSEVEGTAAACTPSLEHLQELGEQVERRAIAQERKATGELHKHLELQRQEFQCSLDELRADLERYRSSALTSEHLQSAVTDRAAPEQFKDLHELMERRAASEQRRATKMAQEMKVISDKLRELQEHKAGVDQLNELRQCLELQHGRALAEVQEILAAVERKADVGSLEQLTELVERTASTEQIRSAKARNEMKSAVDRLQMQADAHKAYIDELRSRLDKGDQNPHDGPTLERFKAEGGFKELEDALLQRFTSIDSHLAVVQKMTSIDKALRATERQCSDVLDSQRSLMESEMSTREQVEDVVDHLKMISETLEAARLEDERRELEKAAAPRQSAVPSFSLWGSAPEPEPPSAAAGKSLRYLGRAGQRAAGPGPSLAAPPLALTAPPATS